LGSDPCQRFPGLNSFLAGYAQYSHHVVLGNWRRLLEEIAGTEQALAVPFTHNIHRKLRAERTVSCCSLLAFQRPLLAVTSRSLGFVYNDWY